MLYVKLKNMKKVYLVSYENGNIVRSWVNRDEYNKFLAEKGCAGGGDTPELFHDQVSLDESAVQHYIKNLTGKIFTMLDASVVNDRQLKSMKDIVRNAVADTYGDILSACWDNSVNDYCNDIVRDMTDEEFAKLGTATIEEVVGM